MHIIVRGKNLSVLSVEIEEMRDKRNILLDDQIGRYMLLKVPRGVR